MDDSKQQVVDRLKQANNILVTVRNNPTVDLLSACIGLTLVLGKMDKHAAAVFSGEVPDTMEFLKPEETIEKTPNSLRDFIIALDKSKADKLRYKVEDKVVRIFITPYRTSITQDDLDFSQGDFNIDAIVALGAHEQAELDTAVTTHGRILHDATVISINNTPNGNLGSLNWQDTKASSVSEMVTQLVDDLNRDMLDGQIATALLTGIVAETARFSNDKTTPKTMTLAGDLMAAGANQQLVANELQAGGQLATPAPASGRQDSERSGDGTLAIDHDTAAEAAVPAPEPPKVEPPAAEPPKQGEREMLPMPEPGQLGTVHSSSGDLFSEEFAGEPSSSLGSSFLVDAPDVPGPVSQVNAQDDPTLPSSQTVSEAPADELPKPAQQPEPFAMPSEPPKPAADMSLKPAPPSGQTLEEIERSVGSSHLEQAGPAPYIDEADARSKVLEALNQGENPLGRLEPIQALNANPLGDSLHADDVAALPTPPQAAPPTASAPSEIGIDADGNLKLSTPALDMPLPPVGGAPMPGGTPESPPDSGETPQNKAPSVPPPIPGLFGS